MNPHRKGNAFDAGVPGDPRLHDAIQRRTPQGAGVQVTRVHGGTILTPRKVPAPARTIIPLHILRNRPPYIAAAAAPAEGYKRYHIEWGTLNEQIASNWDDHFDINATTYFFAVATLRTTSTLLVTSWEILTGAAIDSEETADWAVDAVRPSEAVTVLGAVTVDVDGNHSISNFGGGSLRLTEHISNIEAGTAAGDVLLGKQLTFSRLTY